MFENLTETEYVESESYVEGEDKVVLDRTGFLRIVKGYDSSRRPWLAILLVGSKKIGQCGGTIVSPFFIVSAAHCVCSNFKDDKELCDKDHITHKNVREKVLVYLGVKMKADMGRSRTLHRTRELFLHPERVKRELKVSGSYAGPFDILMLKLEERIEYKKGKIMPICFDPKIGLREEQKAHIAGLGSEVFSKAGCWTDGSQPNPYTPCQARYKQGDDGCVKETLPPINDDCREVLHDIGFEERFPQNVDYVKIVGSEGNLSCYPRLKKEHGWCKVKGVANALVDPSAEWGYCSHHCQGAGRVDVKEHKSKRVQETDVVIPDNVECEHLAKSAKSIFEGNTEFCAGKLTVTKFNVQTVEWKDGKWVAGPIFLEELRMWGGSDACQGDSGGPIWIWETGPDDKDRAYLIGVVSRGKGCAWRNQPGIFTSLGDYYEWMVGVMGEGNGFCSGYEEFEQITVYRDSAEL